MKEDTVIYIKLRTTGEDIVGADMGHDPDDTVVILYRPIKIITRTDIGPTGSLYVMRMPELYAPFDGDGICIIPKTDIMMYNRASEFYSRYYWKSVGHMTSIEEDFQDKMSVKFDADDMEDAVEAAGKMLVVPNTNFVQ